METPLKKGKVNPDAIEKWLKDLDKELDKLAKSQADEIDAELEALDRELDAEDE